MWTVLLQTSIMSTHARLLTTTDGTVCIHFRFERVRVDGWHLGICSPFNFSCTHARTHCVCVCGCVGHLYWYTDARTHVDKSKQIFRNVCQRPRTRTFPGIEFDLWGIYSRYIHIPCIFIYAINTYTHVSISVCVNLPRNATPGNGYEANGRAVWGWFGFGRVKSPYRLLCASWCTLCARDLC